MSVLVLGILALLFWELEYQHISLILWLLIALALLWGCAQVAVSLQAYPRSLQRRTRSASAKSPRVGRWVVPLVSAVALGILGVILWAMGFETTSQLLGFLVIVAFLWCCVQVSFLLRPRSQLSQQQGESQMQWSEPLFPGSSLQSGFYNEGNPEVWDSNEKLPPHSSY